MESNVVKPKLINVNGLLLDCACTISKVTKEPICVVLQKLKKQHKVK